MKTFPNPLTCKEEKFYLERYGKGDEEARNILIERNLRLVAHIAKKYQTGSDDSEDILSIGTIGLIKAVTTFDCSKGNKLATYAVRCIENEILMMLRGKKKSSKEVSLYEPIGTDKEGNSINLFDVIEGAEEDAFQRLELEQDVAKLYELADKVLTGREREIMKLRYGLWNSEEYTQREIAQKMGISRSYVSRIEKQALGKLRVEFEKAGH